MSFSTGLLVTDRRRWRVGVSDVRSFLVRDEWPLQITLIMLSQQWFADVQAASQPVRLPCLLVVNNNCQLLLASKVNSKINHTHTDEQNLLWYMEISLLKEWISWTERNEMREKKIQFISDNDNYRSKRRLYKYKAVRSNGQSAWIKNVVCARLVLDNPAPWPRWICWY